MRPFLRNLFVFGLSCGFCHNSFCVQTGVLADRHPQRLSAGRGREPFRRQSRPPGARPGHRDDRRNDRPFLVGNGGSARRLAVRRAAATKAKSSKLTAPARPRPSSIRQSSKCTRSLWHRTAPSMRPPRPTDASTRLTEPAKARLSSIPKTNTSGASRSIKREISMRARAKKG